MRARAAPRLPSQQHPQGQARGLASSSGSSWRQSLPAHPSLSTQAALALEPGPSKPGTGGADRLLM